MSAESDRGGTHRFAIGEDDAERRIDALLRRRLGLPRGLAMKLLRTGDVRLNGKKAKPDARLAPGDTVEVRRVEAAPAPPPRASAPSGKPRPERAREHRPLRGIIHEDADVVVFDKPPGLVSHKGSGHERGAVDLLLEHLGDAGPRARGDVRPALVNRLDRDTSGLLVMARTGLALRRLNATIRKGGFENAALRKEKSADGLERMVVVGDEEEGALASVTRYRTVRVLAGGAASLLALEPETGRTHQIRAHLRSRGHPIALDRKYGDARWSAEIEERTGLARLFLHAETLAFEHPRTGEVVRFRAPLPADLEAALERLEGDPHAG
jgi:23S rRNA pseudouridine955/2504/2580 synthase